MAQPERSSARCWFHRLLPLVVSACLLGVILWWVSPSALAEAAAELDWRLLVPLTIVAVVALYLWDAVCLPAIYSVDGHRFGYRQSLRLRGLSYLAGAFHYEAGQAALAWGTARIQNTGLPRMLARALLLAYHDLVVLISIALAGSLLTTDPRAARIQPYLVAGLIGALAVGIVVWALPKSVKAKLRIGSGGPLLQGWSLARSFRLLPLRAGYFAIVIAYVALALSACRLSVDHEVVLSTVPMVILSDALPSFASLGTRDTALQLLLAPEEPATLLAMSLLWTAGMTLGQFSIGLALLAVRQLKAIDPGSKPVAEVEAEEAIIHTPHSDLSARGAAHPHASRDALALDS